MFLAVPYLIGAGLLVAVDRRDLWVVGAGVQVVVVVLFVMFGAGVFGPGQGVFGYDALSGLHMEWWAAVITGAEVVLLGLLSYLAFTPHDVRHGVTMRPHQAAVRDAQADQGRTTSVAASVAGH